MRPYKLFVKLELCKVVNRLIKRRLDPRKRTPFCKETRSRKLKNNGVFHYKKKEKHKIQKKGGEKKAICLLNT